MGRGAIPAGRAVVARRPRAKKSPANGAARVGELEARLAAALEQQAATSEILRLMAASPGNVQPVLDAVAVRAAQLCKAPFARVLLLDGDALHVLADYAIDGGSPMPPVPVVLKRTSISGRAVIDSEIIHHADIVPLLDAEFSDARENVRRIGCRAVLAVPLMREAGGFGAIFLWRREPGLFAPDQVDLVQTFARQAAIAIENVRLFKEVEVRNRDLTEALEQQTATSEILRAISRSPTEVEPVFETIAANALRLCDASFSVCYRFDGELIHIAALHHVKPEGVAAFRAAYPCLPSRGGITQRAILTGGVVHVPDVRQDPEYVYHDAAKNADYRSVLSVPMLRDGRPIGAITVFRDVPRLFPDSQIALLQTFADQAVIAIENVRLFTELGARNRDLTEALEQQTATSEILRAISSSPSNVQPVFDIIAERAGKLCGAEVAVVSRFDGAIIELAAIHGVVPDGVKIIRKLYPMSIDASTITARVIRGSAVVHIADVLAEHDYGIKDFARAARYRGGLGVPIVRAGQVIGSIFVGRATPGLYTDSQVELLKTFSEQAVIAIENVRLFTELEARNREVTEALERQTATSDVLKVISRSAFNLQPVLDTVIESAVRLCGAEHGHVHRYDGKLLRLAAGRSSVPAMLDYLREHPAPLGPGGISGIAGLERRVVHWHDVLEQSGYKRGEAQKLGGYRTMLAVPMLTETALLGVMVLWKTKVEPFTEKQIELVTTFADQAVIAIENVRLFTELETRNHDLTEALEQQTATSDILRVISSSPTDVQPVFDAIARDAMRLCNADYSVVGRYDGQLLHLVAHEHVRPEGVQAMLGLFPMRLSRKTTSSRAILERDVVHVPDVLEDPDYDRAVALGIQNRSTLGVPMLRDGSPIGAISVGRLEPRPFSEKQIALVKTFADQAVIAIENVRLFTELDARNRDLSEALEQQTATGEVLRVISSSPTDVQPVFDAIAASARRLCDGTHGAVLTYDGSLIYLAALDQFNPEGAESLRRAFPMAPSRASSATRAILYKEVVNIPDVLADREYVLAPAAQASGYRSVIAVPMLREGNPTGVITVTRAAPGAFPSNQVELLRTFADQAVIAIENVRLFTELGARNKDLTEALEQQTATSEILRVISQSQQDVQPVFDTIAASALTLCRASVANVVTLEGSTMHLRAVANVSREGADALSHVYPRQVGSDSGAGRAILTGGIVVIPDAVVEPGYAIGTFAQLAGFRSVLAIPLLRDGRPIGAINVGRSEPGTFSDNQIALLQTFADQAVIAIENVRLFKELEARTTELTQSVGELKALGEVGQAVGSTLDLETVLRTIVSRATELAGMDGGAIYEYDEAKEQFYLHTAERYPAELVDMLRAKPIRKGEGALGRLAVVAEPVQIRSIADDRTYKSRVREILLRLGYRSLLAIPLLREDRLLGGLIMNRKTAGEFAPQVIELLKTFATQSALAIQNARLFREIEDKSRQLEVASRHKSEFLANMSHELRTPLNAIIGFSEVLAERMFGEINDKQAEYLGDILESGRHLLSLINDILDLSKIEAGRMELELSEFNLPDAIDNTLTLVRERAQRREIRLARSIDPRVGNVSADERKVKQVLLNLLSNALKFTPEGGRIDVGVAVRDGMAEVSVTDTGVGIASEDLDAVFEEFRQVGTAAKKVEGTGLGLAISRKFIELHGGRIWVTSTPGVGSTFAFTLPHPARA